MGLVEMLKLLFCILFCYYQQAICKSRSLSHLHRSVGIRIMVLIYCNEHIHTHTKLSIAWPSEHTLGGQYIYICIYSECYIYIYPCHALPYITNNLAVCRPSNHSPCNEHWAKHKQVLSEESLSQRRPDSRMHTQLRRVQPNCYKSGPSWTLGLALGTEVGPLFEGSACAPNVFGRQLESQTSHALFNLSIFYDVFLTCWLLHAWCHI